MGGLGFNSDSDTCPMTAELDFLLGAPTLEDMSTWTIPSGMKLGEEAFAVLMEHMALTCVRDAKIDGYLDDEALVAKVASFPSITREVLDRYSSRHGYDEESCPNHPHAMRNFVICPLMRADRESPVRLETIWTELAFVIDADCRMQWALWLSLSRRAFHNFPPSWEVVLPALVELIKQPAFHPQDAIFENTLRQLAQDMGGTSKLYGRGRHWYSPSLQEERDNGHVEWLADTINILRDTYNILQQALCTHAWYETGQGWIMKPGNLERNQ